MSTQGAKDRGEAIKRAREALREAGFRCLCSHILRGGEEGKEKVGEFWKYSNGYEVIILDAIWDPRLGWDGWDVYAPISDSPKVDDTIAAIKARAREAA